MTARPHDSLATCAYAGKPTGAEHLLSSRGKVRPRDGFRAWCEGAVRRRDPVRADRLLLAHADTARRAPLDFTLLAGRQCHVLGAARASFRAADAYAKAGRERYALTAPTRDDFAACLRDATDPDLPEVEPLQTIRYADDAAGAADLAALIGVLNRCRRS